MTISHAEATAAAEAAARAPRSVNVRTAASSVSKMVSGNPPSIKRRASRPPIRPTPMKPTFSSDIAHLLEDFSCDPEAVYGSRHAAIDRDLQEHFFDLVFRYTIRQRTFNVCSDLVRPVERGKHGEI